MSRILPLLLVFISVATHAQEVTGKWKTIDDETGNPRSIVDIYEKGGKLYGKISKLISTEGEDPDPVCSECDEEDDRYNKKVIGMEILRGLTKNSDGSYEGGSILDPKNGKIYRCKIWIEGKDLKLRGYLGPFYRTQTWLRSQ